MDSFAISVTENLLFIAINLQKMLKLWKNFFKAQWNLEVIGLSLNFPYRWPIEALNYIYCEISACKIVGVLWFVFIWFWFFLGNVRDSFPKEYSRSPYDNLSLLLSHAADKLCWCEKGLIVTYFSLLNLNYFFTDAYWYFILENRSVSRNASCL